MVDIPITENDAVITVVATSNGQTAFDFDFLIFDKDHVKAIFTELATGIETDLVNITDFTIDGIEDVNGETLTLSAISALIGDTLTMYRDVPVERLADYQQSGDFQAATINRELDLQTQMMQELNRDSARAVKTAFGDPLLLPLPTFSAGKALIWDNTLNKLINGPDGDEIANAQGYAVAAGVSATGAATSETNAAASAASVQPYADRATAIAATVDAAVTHIAYYTASGVLRGFVVGAVGVAFTTNAGARNWVPAKKAAPNDYAENTTPGTTDMTAAIASWLAFSGDKEVLPEVYLHDPVSAAVKVNVDATGATFKKKSASAATEIDIEFKAGSEYSKWIGGTFDGNRAALQAAYLVLNPTQPAYFNGYKGMVTSAADIIVSGVKLLNHVEKPFMFKGDRNIITNIETENAASVGVFGYECFTASRIEPRPVGAGALGQHVENVKVVGTDNAGLFHSQHAVDIVGPKDGTYKNIHVIEQDGDTSGSSTFLSAITIEYTIGCKFDGIGARDPASDTLIHLMVSIVGDNGSHFSNVWGKRYAGFGLERNACVDSTFINPSFDAEFVTTTAVPSGNSSSIGLSDYEGAWNVERTAKSLLGNLNVKTIGGRFTRHAYGGNVKGGRQEFVGTDFSGNLERGLAVTADIATDYFSAAVNVPTRTVLSNVTCLFNGGAGLVDDGGLVTVHGGEFSNNGQDGTGSRYGVQVQNTTQSELLDFVANDTQEFTVVDGVSFEPHTSDTDGFVYVQTTQASKLHNGQFINLLNADGAADVLGRIYDVGTDDVLKIKVVTAPVTLSATGNSTAMAGTWSGSSRVLTGIGGAASTEVLGQTWVTDGAEWRRIVKATSTNEITLNSEFTATLSGATLTMLTVDLEGVPSQLNGVRAFGTALGMLLRPAKTEGNITAGIGISVKGNLLAGSEFVETYVTTINALAVTFASNIPRNHSPVGISSRVDTALSGGGITSWRSEIKQASGVALTYAIIPTGQALAKNTKAYGYGGDYNSVGDGNVYLQHVCEGGTATAGQITTKVTYKVTGDQELPDV